MKLNRLLAAVISYCFLVVFCSLDCYSQNIINTIITGSVYDSKTKEPLAFVSISLENTSTGTVTDINGKYSLLTIATVYKISFSYIGYEPESRLIYPGKTQVIDVGLNPAAIELSEIEIKPAKKSYSNKDNPAVALINKVIDNKSKNRIEALDFYKYDKYEKISVSLSNLEGNFKQPKVFDKFDIILKNVDTSRLDGKKNIPIFIKETQSDFYYRKNPKAVKEIIKAEKSIRFDEYIDNKGFSANIKYLYQDINIYDNDIFFLSNKFLSPVATSAPVFYKYFIIDTSLVNNVSCIQVFFEPRNPSDLLFHGFLFITSDSLYAIKKIDMSFNKKINIDWVNDVRIIQNFDQVSGKTWVLTNDDIFVDFGISQNTMGLYGQKEVWFNNYSVNEALADSVFRGPSKIYNLRESVRNPAHWDSARQYPLTDAQRNLYTIVDSVKKIPAFRRRMDLVMILTSEFLNLGKFEIGPVGTFYSFNVVEGSRPKFGGRTTEEFNKRIYFDSYLAYGFKDEQFKYKLGATYSLSGQSVYKFPVNAVKMTYQYETETPGQMLQYTTQDNILLSFKRGVDNKMLYNRTLRMEYLNEFENHFSYALGYNYTRQTPAGSLFFTVADNLPLTYNVPYLNISEVFMKLRFAPKEEFYQGKLYRAPIVSKYPTIQFQAAIGSRNFKNDYDYQKIKLGISKRFYLSVIGYTDIATEAGKIFGKVSFPLLFIPNANQTYSYLKNSYNMMNFLEFASDRYIALNIDHSFNGFFFNKIPLLKLLKMREVATFKMLYGGVSNLNDPLLNSDLFRFPADNNGNPTTFSLGQKPYIEASLGISNILRVLRVDVIRRFTYLGNPNVSSIGIRLQVRIDI